MFKLNFEKTAVFVLVLIICISTADIFSQYFDIFFNSEKHYKIDADITRNISFPASLLKADQLYKQELYGGAQEEYFKLANMPGLSQQQKSAVHFKLGMCNYKLKEYGMARDSFIKSAELNNNDPVAYNNAAVCSFYLKEAGKAEELEKLAVASLPVIEYQYNLARIYEALGRYEEAVKYYAIVAGAEENITKEDRIDPVRIKNKVMRITKNSGNIVEIANELMIALRLKDSREVFVIEDVDMDIKNKSFKWNISDENGISKLNCSYDREDSDPYNLIDSLQWTVKSGGKIVFTSKRDEFSVRINEGISYDVYLDIDYDTNKSIGSYVSVQKSSDSYSNNITSKSKTSPMEEKPKYYKFAVYEQVFEKAFRINEKGYVDRFNAVWGKDEIITKLTNKDFIDAQSALYMKNNLKSNAGIWADLSSLINDKRLKGRTISIKFYGKKISDSANLNVIIRTKVGKPYKNITRKFELEDKWKQFGVDVPIPFNAESLTMSFRTMSGQELKLDGFIITIVK